MKLNFFENISTTKKLLAFFLISVGVIFLLYRFQDKFLAEIAITFVFALLLILCKEIWLTEENGKTIQKFLFFFALLVAVSYAGWKDYLLAWVKPILPKDFDKFPIIKGISSPIVLVAVLLIIAFISFLVRDNTVMKEHTKSFDKDFPERSFQSRLANYKKRIQIDIDAINSDNNWNDFYFTPIEAEVEINNKDNKKLRKVTDLLKAIKSDKKSKVFLIIGDPGSGKSTALRKLASDLLSEVEHTRKIPLYINLKDWAGKKNWTRDNPPTQADIYDFTINYLKKKKDVFADEFVDEYFKRLYESGRLFFLFDSFDEIPEVLDANEDSWIIDALSEAFYNFLAGANESRGILSSRIFRRPTEKFKTKTVLELRPFSEIKIEQTFSKALNNLSKDFFINFFRNRLDLLSVARNPFSAALIIQYLKENSFSIPKNQIEIYENYIHKRLLKCAELMAEYNLNEEEIIEFARDLSYYIFSSLKFGLEIGTKEIYTQFNSKIKREKIDYILSVMVFAKIGRLGATDKNFSFVHRRFNEYFVVLKFKENPCLVQKESIPLDSRVRDAMVLYCELAEETHAREIANFCWSEVKKLGDLKLYDREQLLKSIQCLRFLCDAFRTKTNLLLDFQHEIGGVILNNISNGNTLQKKWAVEGIVLLDTATMSEAILNAFQTDITWIQEESLKACRYLPSINFDIHKRIFKYLLGINSIQLYKNINNLFFSTELSDAFKKVNTYLFLKKIEFKICIICLFLLFFVSPAYSLAILIFILYNILVEMILHSDSSTSIPIRSIIFSNAYMYLGSIGFYLFALTIPHSKIIGYKWLLGILIIIFLPKIDLYTLTKYKFLTPKIKVDKKVIYINLGVISFLGIAFFGFYFFKKYLIAKISLISIMSIIVIFLAYFVGDAISDYINDLKKLSKMDMSNSIERSNIFENMYSLNSSWAKKKYLNSLKRNSVIAVGIWPSGELPIIYHKMMNSKNEKKIADVSVNSLLAQMEEKWLGLNK